MKKTKNDSLLKRVSQNQASKSQKLRVRWREAKRVRNFFKNQLKKGDQYLTRRLQRQYSQYSKVLAPEEFSFAKNTYRLIEFLNKLNRLFEKSKKVFVILKLIKVIDYDAIVVLFSIMIKFKAKGIDFNGDFPQDRRAAEILEKSGFTDYLFRPVNDKDTYDFKKTKTIFTHASKNVDSELGINIIERVSERIWKEKRFYKGFQRTLLELMQNTNNHANDQQQGEKHWWLSVNVKESEKCASFAFIDYGVGIFSSLKHKKEESKFFNALERLKEFFTFRNNADVLKLILTGELHRTVSNKSFRGKGLPGVKQVLDRNQISNLIIITNDVYADVASDKYEIMKNNFSGTFIYWEIDNQNEYHKWTL